MATHVTVAAAPARKKLTKLEGVSFTFNDRAATLGIDVCDEDGARVHSGAAVSVADGKGTGFAYGPGGTLSSVVVEDAAITPAALAAAFSGGDFTAAITWAQGVGLVPA